uniref:Uncharacterized protein n=1 Tax=Ascaris lumbricoides TaxID=6252 RepID=A0A0M3HUI2_ASCLU
MEQEGAREEVFVQHLTKTQIVGVEGGCGAERDAPTETANVKKEENTIFLSITLETGRLKVAVEVARQGFSKDARFIGKGEAKALICIREQAAIEVSPRLLHRLCVRGCKDISVPIDETVEGDRQILNVQMLGHDVLLFAVGDIQVKLKE